MMLEIHYIICLSVGGTGSGQWNPLEYSIHMIVYYLY